MFKKLDQRKQNFYKKLAVMLKEIIQKRSTLKTEVYSTNTPIRYYPILHKVLLNYSILIDINKKTGYMQNKYLACILIYELLNKNLRNDGYRRKFTKALGETKLIEYDEPTYVRINMNNGCLNDLSELEIEKTCVDNVYKVTKCKIETMSIKKYIKSKLDNKIRIQTLESCLPSFILDPEKGSTVIDATAAPGNKTTHVSDILQNTGKVLAYEKNKERYEVLQEHVKTYGSKNIECFHQDFLTLDPTTVKADYILVDPSCSGSGIHLNYKKDVVRLSKLKNFQCMILNHALKFEAKRIVYSVCSIHEEEGEEVVKEALEKNPKYELMPLPLFGKSRGSTKYEFGDKVIKCYQNDEGSKGFFIAAFIKKE